MSIHFHDIHQINWSTDISLTIYSIWFSFNIKHNISCCIFF